MKSIEKGRVWRVLSCALLECMSAVIFYGALFCPLGDRLANVERHQAMLTDQAADLRIPELDNGLRADLDALVYKHLAFVESAADGLIGILEEDAQKCVTHSEVVSNSYLDLSGLIAQYHGICGAGREITKRRSPFNDPSMDRSPAGNRVTAPAPLENVSDQHEACNPSPRSGIFESATTGERRFIQL